MAAGLFYAPILPAPRPGGPGDAQQHARLSRLLGLDSGEETEARMLWIGIIALAERYPAGPFRG